MFFVLFFEIGYIGSVCVQKGVYTQKVQTAWPFLPGSALETPRHWVGRLGYVQHGRLWA